VTAKEQPMNKPKAPAPRAKTPAVPASQVPAERPQPPRSVLTAVRLMYAGAVLTAVGLVISVIAVAADSKSLRASHPHATAAQLHATQNFLITIAVVSGIVEIGAWLFMARANRGGLKWARIAASALFALSTWSFVSHLFGAITIGNIGYSALMWLVGLAAVFFLWQKDSSAYFS
jgi:uncharacterized BrkB/YihY/UPF0761 family membrane protein